MFYSKPPCWEWHVQGIQGIQETMVKSWLVMAVLRKVDITKPKKAKLVKKRKDLAAQIFHNSLKGLQISQKTTTRLSLRGNPWGRGSHCKLAIQLGFAKVMDEWFNLNLLSQVFPTHSLYVQQQAYKYSTTRNNKSICFNLALYYQKLWRFPSSLWPCQVASMKKTGMTQ